MPTDPAGSASTSARATRTGGADFLAEASRLLADTLDYEDTLASVARLAIPSLGAWCIVDVVQDDGRMRRLAIVHPDPEKQELARRLEAGWHPHRDDPLGVPAVVRTRRSEILPLVDDAFLREVAGSERNLRILRDLGIGSMMVVPLVARGEVLGAITFISPARERYTAEDLALAEDLAARAAIAIDNARLYREARRARVAALEASRTQSRFLASAAHEIRNPLNSIIGYTELLEQRVDGPLNEKQRTKLARVRASSEYLRGLVERILDIAQAQAGHLTVRQQSEDLREAIAAAVAVAQPQAEKYEVAILNRCSDPVDYVGDPIRVRQILVNLLLNACRFTPAGGRITIECESFAKPLAPILSGAGPWLRVDVEDTGIGMPEEKLEAIFEPFVQIDPGVDRPAGGAGLGLTISRQLARLMGGELAASSEPGVGSRFSLWLRMKD
jgi:signal transduction histidine kinase